jgi:hypothetical protein
LKRQEITKEKNLETFLVLVLALVVIGYLSNRPLFYLISIGLGAVGLFIPFLASWITFLWLSFSEILGGVMSKILLSIVFFIVLFPVALLKKIFTKKKKMESSNWTDRNHTYTAKDLQNPW